MTTRRRAPAGIEPDADAPVAQRLVRRRSLAANLLTLARLPLAAVLWLNPGDPGFFLSILAVGALSDIVDGAAARWARRGHEAEARAADRVGSWLDPLCDRVFVASAVLAAVWAYAPPLWLLAVVLLRDLVQTTLLALVFVLQGRLHLQRIDFHATRWGKATTLLQFLTLVVIVLEPADGIVLFGARMGVPLSHVLAALAGGVGAVAAYVVVRRARRELGVPT